MDIPIDKCMTALALTDDNNRTESNIIYPNIRQAASRNGLLHRENSALYENVALPPSIEESAFQDYRTSPAFLVANNSFPSILRLVLPTPTNVAVAQNSAGFTFQSPLQVLKQPTSSCILPYACQVNNAATKFKTLTPPDNTASDSLPHSLSPLPLAVAPSRKPNLSLTSWETPNYSEELTTFTSDILTDFNGVNSLSLSSPTSFGSPGVRGIGRQRKNNKRLTPMRHSGPSSDCKRKSGGDGLFNNCDEPASKVFVFEERIAASIESLNLEDNKINDRHYSVQGDGEPWYTTQNLDRSQNGDFKSDNEEFSRLRTVLRRLLPAARKTFPQPRLEISKELQLGLHANDLLPKMLLKDLHKPDMQVVLWKSLDNFINDAICSSSTSVENGNTTLSNIQTGPNPPLSFNSNRHTKERLRSLDAECTSQKIQDAKVQSNFNWSIPTSYETMISATADNRGKEFKSLSSMDSNDSVTTNITNSQEMDC